MCVFKAPFCLKTASQILHSMHSKVLSTTLFIWGSLRLSSQTNGSFFTSIFSPCTNDKCRSNTYFLSNCNEHFSQNSNIAKQVEYAHFCKYPNWRSYLVYPFTASIKLITISKTSYFCRLWLRSHTTYITVLRMDKDYGVIINYITNYPISSEVTLILSLYITWYHLCVIGLKHRALIKIGDIYI